MLLDGEPHLLLRARVRDQDVGSEHPLQTLQALRNRDALDDEVAYLLEFAGASAVIAEDEEQVDKLLNVSDRLPKLRHIVYSDPRGMRKHEDARLLPVSELVRAGDAAHAADPSAWAQLVAGTRGEDVAVLCTSSGTTARPPTLRKIFSARRTSLPTSTSRADLSRA